MDAMDALGLYVRMLRGMLARMPVVLRLLKELHDLHGGMVGIRVMQRGVRLYIAHGFHLLCI